MISFFSSRLKKMKESVRKFVMHFFILIFTTSLLVTLSSLLYIFFYNLVIPRISLFAPLNFVFKECGTKRCDYPTAFIDFASPPFQFQFERGEHYKFVLDLLVPESPANQDVGMFILAIEFIGEPWRNNDRTSKQVVFKTEKKAAMLHYKSPIIQALSSILYSPLLVHGLAHETQTITREVVSLYEEKPEYFLTAINVIIESKKLSIYEGHLTIQTKLEGFRSFMYHYPFLSFMIGAPVFLVPVIAAFLSVNSNSFEKKRKKLTAIIARSREFGLNSEASLEEEEVYLSSTKKNEFGKDSDSGKYDGAFKKKSDDSFPNDGSSEIETLTARNSSQINTKDFEKEDAVDKKSLEGNLRDALQETEK